MWSAQRLLKYGIVTGVTLGTLASLKANQYNFDSIGVVRLGRAAVTVSDVQTPTIILFVIVSFIIFICSEYVYLQT
jgi:hypothetical protein